MIRKRRLNDDKDLHPFVKGREDEEMKGEETKILWSEFVPDEDKTSTRWFYGVSYLWCGSLSHRLICANILPLQESPGFLDHQCKRRIFYAKKRLYRGIFFYMKIEADFFFSFEANLRQIHMYSVNWALTEPSPAQHASTQQNNWCFHWL